MLRRAVFLDRDGVINRAEVREGRPFPPSSLLFMKILPGVFQALSALRQAGWLLIVVTNQPDVARGAMSRQAVEEINNYLISALPIDEFRCCYHDSTDNCSCRKPLPGSILEASRFHAIDLTKSFMIGDRWRDIEAGQRAGCRTFFIDYGYTERQPDYPDFKVKSLAEATEIILTQFHGRH